MDKLIIKGAREHNLKNINLELPRDKLIVISGISGSGKSSLAFDTIFAEGQRRYVESLSAYARQFLGRMEKPDVDYIEGLSPAISIEQKTTHRNPRSTVGTVTEIYDYYRLLWARIGKAHCPKCGKPIKEQSIDQILDSIMAYPEGSRIMLLSPVVRGKKGEHQQIISDAVKSGFARIRIDGEIRNLDEEIKLKKNNKHNIEIVISRVKLEKDRRKRIAESVETALEVSDGSLIVVELSEKSEKETFFSRKNACFECGFSMPELQPRLFSFNKGAVATVNPSAAWHRSWFESLSKHLGFDLDTPFKDLSEEIMDTILNGSKDTIDVVYENKAKSGRYEYSSNFKGVLNDLKKRYLETNSDGVKDWLEKYMSQKKCEMCNGKRLGEESLAVTVGGKNIYEVTELDIEQSIQFFNELKLDATDKFISTQIMKEIIERLNFLKSVGLNYLTLHRKASTLSGGEAQRIRLATQIGSSLMGVLYILDEPTIGLHQRDNKKLIETLKHLRDIGNTLIVVEHDEITLRTADYIVDLGPGAGVHGGHVIAQGTLAQVLKNKKSITGQYLSGKISIPERTVRRKGNGKKIVIHGAREHNLKNISVEFPLNKLIAITGVSGSGKSTLLTDLLYPIILNHLNRSKRQVGDYDSVEGVEFIDKIINIDQSAIGRTPRSNPATYVGLFTPIRDLFASLPESKARGYKPGRFSFNVKGGRCENCQGAGTKKIEMHFLPDVYVTCDVCKGKRFNNDTLDIRYKGKNIHDVLDMTIEKAALFFDKIPVIKNKLDTLNSVGLDYLTLGQSALTLSGGEAQRVKLSLELSKRSTGKTFYILDEPTTGLHFADVKKLMEVLHSLVDKGNTIALIEHNMDVIWQSDYIVDLGPEGGEKGGSIVVEGTPEEISLCESSYTGIYLKREKT
ncbi:MAG: excinuclease ABC subunit UvrA [Spirochaetaceae bacterium]|nr:excinuclease ABC subunit UvrA [Spirochaetaceae bacterium]